MTIADFACPQDFDCVNMVAAQTQAESHPKLPSRLKFVKGDLADMKVRMLLSPCRKID